MLATDLCSLMKVLGHQVIELDLPDLDIRDEVQVGERLRQCSPEAVVNCAAYTNVDGAESEPEPARAVNRDGALYVAKACSNMRIPLIHISTDYVFDGQSATPYRETDTPKALSVYGMSKLEGELAVQSAAPRHYIVRTAWLYGVHGKNFVKTILQHARSRRELRVVADQYGCPTWTMDLARVLIAILERSAAGNPIPWGIYHCCGSGVTTWHRLAEETIRAARTYEPMQAERVVAITTAEYPATARRPAYSALDCQKIESALGTKLPAWQESLKLMVSSLYGKPSPMPES